MLENIVQGPWSEDQKHENEKVSQQLEEAKNVETTDSKIKTQAELDELQRRLEERFKEREEKEKLESEQQKPEEKVAELTKIEENIEEENSVFECKACGEISTKNVIPLHLLIFLGGKNTMPILSLVCPNCCSIQLPRQVLDRMISQLSGGVA